MNLPGCFSFMTVFPFTAFTLQKAADSLAAERAAQAAAERQLREQAELDKRAAQAWLDRSDNLRQLPLLAELAGTSTAHFSRAAAAAALLAAANVQILQQPKPGPLVTEAPRGRKIAKAAGAVHPDKAMQAGAPVFVVQLYARAAAVANEAAQMLGKGG